ncbi:MAG: RRXRR domain-containing protein [Desulfobacterales bacterium]|nr:RRXRR domain-containing protein [Desulfobacterales bacterium]
MNRLTKFFKDFMHQVYVISNTDKPLMPTVRFGKVRRMLKSGRAIVLEHYGLAAALRWYGEKFESRFNIPVKVIADDIQLRFENAWEISMFRIAQEALLNVAKHSKAKHVEIVLEVNSNLFLLSIKDDGIGFDPHALYQNKGYGLGLLLMKERALSINASCDIKSEIGKGTDVIVLINIDELNGNLLKHGC